MKYKEKAQWCLDNEMYPDLWGWRLLINIVVNLKEEEIDNTSKNIIDDWLICNYCGDGLIFCPQCKQPYCSYCEDNEFICFECVSEEMAEKP